MTLFTIGYRQRTPESLVAALQAQGVRRVVDVRWGEGPAPQWKRIALAATLARAGMGYVDRRAIGNPPDNRGRLRAGRITPAEALVAYRRHVETRASATLRELGRDLRDGDCLLCACADAADCHRATLVEALRAAGFVSEDPAAVVHVSSSRPVQRRLL